MTNYNHRTRTLFLLGLVAVLFLICIVRLFALQIVSGSDYRQQTEEKLVRSTVIKAKRGDIMDRFGTLLATNKMGYSVQVTDSNLSREEFAAVLFDLLTLLQETGEETVSDEFPLTTEGELAFSFPGETKEEQKRAENSWKETYSVEKNATPQQALAYFVDKYQVSKSYDIQMQRKLAGLIFTMKVRGYSSYSPYTVAADVSAKTVGIIKERSLDFPGILVVETPVRTYPNKTLAAHLLGTVGPIYKEEYEKLKGKNYAMDSIIGKQGIELTYEDYLKGKDGSKGARLQVKGDADEATVRPAVQGDSVMLTINADMQKTLEASLARTIAEIGGDCNAGSAVCLDVNNADILAIASYPTFDPLEYNKKFNEYVEDEAKPIWNRAIAGAYAPGSTFKMVSAIAGIEEGVIGPYETILDEGVYMYYADAGYTPECMVWQYGQTHGYVDAEKALQESCNYYFFEVGRRLGIDRLNKYVSMFGLGQKTGIELEGEVAGIVAGPETKKEMKESWYAGDTLQAAIGQSDYLFTPLQLANYIATIANGGTRYKPHILKAVKNPATGEIIKENVPEIEAQLNISDETMRIVKEGMRKVAEEGTASSVFEEFPVPIAGKTGTAEITNGSNNGVFVAYAPFDKPQIAIAIVIEHGTAGSLAAPVARDVFQSYFVDSKETDIVRKNVLL